MKFAVTVIVCLMILASCSVSVGETMYRWVDDSGNVHYSDEPPTKRRGVQEMERALLPGGRVDSTEKLSAQLLGEWKGDMGGFDQNLRLLPDGRFEEETKLPGAMTVLNAGSWRTEGQLLITVSEREIMNNKGALKMRPINIELLRGVNAINKTSMTVQYKDSLGQTVVVQYQKIK